MALVSQAEGSPTRKRPFHHAFFSVPQDTFRREQNNDGVAN